MARLNSEGLRRARRNLPTQRALARLTERVEELEREVREVRSHHQRLAELTDVVQELLLPLSQRDQDKVDEILSRYTDQLG